MLYITEITYYTQQNSHSIHNRTQLALVIVMNVD